MDKPEFHFFVCNSFRASGEPQGACHKKGAFDLPMYIETEIQDRGLNGMVTTTGCLKVCDRGPVMVVYPEGGWYGDLNEEKVDEILDAFEDGESTEAMQLK